MIHPRIDELLNVEAGGVDSRYALVIVAAKRARQINNYHHQLGEGMGFEEAPPPLVESRSKNYLTMALEEIAKGKMQTYDYAQALGLLPTSDDPPLQGGGHTGHGAHPPRITGGIAAYKACELVRLLVKAGHDVLPLPTQAAERFVRGRDLLRARARKSPSTDVRIRTSSAPTCS